MEIIYNCFIFIPNLKFNKMKTLLINVDYTESKRKFWWDSGIKKQKVSFDPETQTIHSVIKELCEDEGMELSYKGRPQGNVFRDKKDGNHKIVGYMYRGKGEVNDRSMVKPVMVFWDVWVTIEEVKEFEFEQIDNF